MAITDEQREFLSRLKAVGMPPMTCTDCIPSVDGMSIEHADTCPVMLDIEKVTAEDAEWFEAHPSATFYHRPATWGEGVQLLLHDEKLRQAPPDMRFSVAGRVRIEQLEPGARLRKFENVYFVVE